MKSRKQYDHLNQEMILRRSPEQTKENNLALIGKYHKKDHGSLHPCPSPSLLLPIIILNSELRSSAIVLIKHPLYSFPQQ